jgi:putative membrane protein
VLLFSHLTLAMSVPVLAIVMIRLGLTDRRAAHRRWARFAWPIWMYVSITGILIYLLLYPLNPTP